MTAASAATPVKSVPPRTVASSSAWLAGLLLGSMLVASPLLAQRTPAGDSARGVAADSIAARLRRAEEAIALLQQQLGEQTSSGVTTRSRMQLELSGRMLVHAFRNERRVNNVDDPQFVRPDSASALPISGVGLAIRQTVLGMSVTARDVLGGSFTGTLDVDFFGGQQPSSGGRTFPLLRLRTAHGAVRWTHGELLVGQEAPLIAATNPVSPAAIGTPAFAAAGNLWLWLPQLRATLETGGPVRVAVQGAVIAPTTGDVVGLFDTDIDAAERSGRPAVEGRLRVRWGEDERASEIGCGGHLGWIALSAATLARTNVAACDARIAFIPRVELRGEAYTGRGLRGLGGGGIGQNLSRSATPLEDRGGWGQINIDAYHTLKIGAGCGIDEPRSADVPAGGRLRNEACASYAILRPAGPLFLGVEIRQIETKYAAGSVTNNHLNLGIGFEF